MLKNKATNKERELNGHKSRLFDCLHARIQESFKKKRGFSPNKSRQNQGHQKSKRKLATGPLGYRDRKRTKALLKRGEEGEGRELEGDGD